jgi:phage FluMu protein Com
MSEDKKCPKCGGELEEGFIHAPRGIYWDTEEHKWHVYTSEALISMWSWTMPRVQAWRCRKCNLIIFGY